MTGPAITNSAIIRRRASYDSSAHPSIGNGSAAHDFKGLLYKQKLNAARGARPSGTFRKKKEGGGEMLGTVAGGPYVFFLARMIAAWFFSLNKKAPAEPQSDQVIWYIHS